MSKPLILINNVYSFRNRGDSAIVESTIHYIRTHAPSAEIYLLSQFWLENSSYYNKFDVASIPPLWDIQMNNNKVQRLLAASGSLLRAFRLGWQSKSKTRSLYEQADLVVDAGGGSLFSSNRYWFYLGLYQHLFNLWIAKQLGKPVIIAPQSIGPFSRLADTAIAASVLRKANVVMARERTTARLLTELNVSHQIVPDIAFLNNYVQAPTAQVCRLVDGIQHQPDDLIKIGLTVLDWRWARAPRSADDINVYIEKIASALSEIGKRVPLKLYIFPQVRASYGDDDLAVSEALSARLASLVDAQTIDLDMAPSDLCYAYEKMDVFVGSRMHSCIFALSRGVPTIGLAYQPKTVGTFDLLGLREYVLDISSFSSCQLATRIDSIVNDRTAQRLRFIESASKAKVQVTKGLDAYLAPYLS